MPPIRIDSQKGAADPETAPDVSEGRGEGEIPNLDGLFLQPRPGGAGNIPDVSASYLLVPPAHPTEVSTVRRFPSAIAILVAFCATAALADLPTIHNPATPANGVVTMQLEEQWRIGGPDDEENFFGLITWAETDDQGLLYVLDVQMCQALVYDKEGTLVKTLFRQGDGPGEVRQPRDLVLMPDGTVGAVQEFPGKIIRVDAEGDPAGDIVPGSGDPAAGGFMALTAAEHRGGTFMLAGVKIDPGENQAVQTRTMFLTMVDDDGVEKKQFLDSQVTWDFTNFTYDEATALPSFWWANAVGPDGRVYAAPDRGAYRINVYATDGSLERIIEREYESWTRTAEERAWFEALLGGAFRNLPFEANLKICDTESDISWLTRGVQVTEDGELWILPSRGTREQPAGVAATFDVFDRDGKFDRQVQVACPEGDATEDGIFLLGDGRLLLIKGYVDAMAATFGGAVEEDEDEEAVPMELICYRVTN